MNKIRMKRVIIVINCVSCVSAIVQVSLTRQGERGEGNKRGRERREVGDITFSFMLSNKYLMLSSIDTEGICLPPPFILTSLPLPSPLYPPNMKNVATASILLFCFIATSATSFSLSDRPTLKYGTAWKKEATANLVYLAVMNGFRHIDTACQPRHYNEAGVGEGWTKAANALGLKREDVWLQTKFSGLDAQDPNNTPYGRSAPLEERVRQSLQVSLKNLQTDYLDSWVMHGPENSWEDNFKVWEAMEEGYDSGKVKQLGISNWYRLDDIQWLYEHARIKPKVRLSY